MRDGLKNADGLEEYYLVDHGRSRESPAMNAAARVLQRAGSRLRDDGVGITSSSFECRGYIWRSRIEHVKCTKPDPRRRPLIAPQCQLDEAFLALARVDGINGAERFPEKRRQECAMVSRKLGPYGGAGL